MPDTEKRKFTRVPFHTKIKVTSGGTILASNRLRDISLGGAFFIVDGSLPEGNHCILDIDLIGPASLLRIQVEGEVVRMEEAGIAVKFTRIDLDSLIHLRHLVKVHAQDPEIVDQEYTRDLLAVTQDESPD